MRLAIRGQAGNMRPSMRKGLAAVACTCVLLLAGCNQIAARDLVREGNAAYEAGRFEEAIDKYTASLEHEPDGVTVFWNRACAAESLVLSLKDAANEQQREARKKWADLALGDLQKWSESLEAPTDEDKKAAHDHRLAVLKADARCDDLIAYWMDKQRQAPNDEDLYTVIARTFDETCVQPEKADEWYVKRTEDFGDKSEKAWYSLAVRRFDPLFPDPVSGLPYNASLGEAERIKIAEEVIAHLDKATKLRPDYRDPYVWRAMAYTQRSLARTYDETSQEPDQKLLALLAREDLMLAWREQKAVCDIDSIPDCATIVTGTDLTTKASELAGKRIQVKGKVVAATLGEATTGANGDITYTFDVEVEIPPPDPAAAAAAAANAPKPKKPKKPKAGDPAAEVPAAPTIALLKVKYTFPAPTPEPAVDAADGAPASPEAGDPLADFKVSVDEIVKLWREGDALDFSGTLEGGTLSAVESPPMACCPPPPLTDAEITAEREQRKMLEQTIADAAAAATPAEPKGGK
jgi:tetratricopeptide (TPR) repeat protein